MMISPKQLFSRPELETIAALATQYDALVLSDEVGSGNDRNYGLGADCRYSAQLQVYEMITYDGLDVVRPAALPGMWERTISLGSAGKAFNTTGWKIGVWRAGHGRGSRRKCLTVARGDYRLGHRAGEPDPPHATDAAVYPLLCGAPLARGASAGLAGWQGKRLL